jgi:hypothetical protein
MQIHVHLLKGSHRLVGAVQWDGGVDEKSAKLITKFPFSSVTPQSELEVVCYISVFLHISATD